MNTWLVLADRQSQEAPYVRFALAVEVRLGSRYKREEGDHLCWQ